MSLVCLEKAKEFEDKIFDTFLPPLICNISDDHPKTDLDNDNLSFHDIQDKCDTPLLEQKKIIHQRMQHHRHKFSQRMSVLMKLRPLDVRKSFPQAELTNPRNGMSSASNLKIERYVCDLMFDKMLLASYD